MIRPLDPIAHHGKYRGQRTRSNHTTVTQSTNPSYRWGRWLAHGPTVSGGLGFEPKFMNTVFSWDHMRSQRKYSWASRGWDKEPEQFRARRVAPLQGASPLALLSKGQLSASSASPKLKLLRYWILLTSLETNVVLGAIRCDQRNVLRKKSPVISTQRSQGKKKKMARMFTDWNV